MLDYGIIRFIRVNIFWWKELNQIDYESTIYRDFFKVDSDRYTMNNMIRGFRNMNEHMSKDLTYPTAELIPEGNRIFIRRQPRYFPAPEHFHEDAMEIMFMLRGETVMSVNQSEIHMKAGDICFIAPNSCHHFFVSEDKVLIYSILVYVDSLKEILGYADKSYFFRIFKKKFLMTPAVYRKQIQDKNW